MNILLLIVFGALVGWITSLIMKTNTSQGFMGDIILGVLGAIVGGIVMNFFGQAGITGFNIYSLLVGVIGATLLVLAGRALMFR